MIFKLNPESHSKINLFPYSYFHLTLSLIIAKNADRSPVQVVLYIDPETELFQGLSSIRRKCDEAKVRVIVRPLPIRPRNQFFRFLYDSFIFANNLKEGVFIYFSPGHFVANVIISFLSTRAPVYLFEDGLAPYYFTEIQEGWASRLSQVAKGLTVSARMRRFLLRNVVKLAEWNSERVASAFVARKHFVSPELRYRGVPVNIISISRSSEEFANRLLWSAFGDNSLNVTPNSVIIFEEPGCPYNQAVTNVVFQMVPRGQLIIKGRRDRGAFSSSANLYRDEPCFTDVPFEAIRWRFSDALCQSTAICSQAPSTAVLGSIAERAGSFKKVLIIRDEATDSTYKEVDLFLSRYLTDPPFNMVLVKYKSLSHLGELLGRELACV
jgi:hypothetical protein